MVKRVGIVVQRYGIEVVGGAEGLARQLAENIQGTWDVSVITTCAKDYATWKNEYSPGESVLNGVRVLRFPTIRARDLAEFSRDWSPLEKKTYALPAELEDEYFQKQGPECPELLDYLSTHEAEYDFFIFFTYLYYTTALGAARVASKAYIVTTAHDEMPFYFTRTFSKLFASVRGIIYLSEEEKELINRIYPATTQIKLIPGTYGVAAPESLTPSETEHFEKKYAQYLREKYFVYLGRFAPSKGCYELIHGYSRFRDTYDPDSKILLVGSSEIPVEIAHGGMIFLGYLDDKERSFLLKNALALINPSPFESLSMVVLEAWMHGTPVIVNGFSPVMKRNCDRSGAGVYYHSTAMMYGLMAWMFYNPEQGRQLGELGRSFVESNFNWKKARDILVNQIG